jgi:hypothetical protein
LQLCGFLSQSTPNLTHYISKSYPTQLTPGEQQSKFFYADGPKSRRAKVQLLVEKNHYYPHRFPPASLIIRTKLFFPTSKSFFPLNFTPNHTPYHHIKPLKALLMDSKVTLSFDQEVISRAKEYAATQNISLSRLVEFLLRKTTMAEYRSMEDYPIADWVREIAEGPAEYRTTRKTRKDLKDQFFSKK